MANQWAHKIYSLVFLSGKGRLSKLSRVAVAGIAESLDLPHIMYSMIRISQLQDEETKAEIRGLFSEQRNIIL